MDTVLSDLFSLILLHFLEHDCLEFDCELDSSMSLDVSPVKSTLLLILAITLAAIGTESCIGKWIWKKGILKKMGWFGLAGRSLASQTGLW